MTPMLDGASNDHESGGRSRTWLAWLGGASFVVGFFIVIAAVFAFPGGDHAAVDHYRHSKWFVVAIVGSILALWPIMLLFAQVVIFFFKEW